MTQQTQQAKPVDSKQVIAQAPSQFDAMQAPHQKNLMNMAIKDPTTAMFDALLSDENVPETIRRKYWFVFHRDNVLGFQDKERKIAKMLNFDILKIGQLFATPYYEYTFDKEFEWNANRHMFETKLDRAVGNAKGVNERLAIPMSIQESHSVTEDKSQSRQSFLSRLLNRK